ncbi:ABC transporter B family member 11-like, partial [Thraustotheca clavata]
MAAQGMGDMTKAKKAVQCIFGIIDRIPPIDCSASTGTLLSAVKGETELKHVVFAYPSRPDSKIYKNYSLTIHAGQTFALVGGSGSGKSTAINLIERFYDPAAGAVYLDGHDLRTLNVQSLRNHISIVSQEPVLFAGTIAENIATGKPGATQAEIEDAAKKANAHDFIMRFPDGYNTSVGDRGVQVSGGQKQRIAIARAIIRDPEVLLLDEATSALDTESERIVQESLDALLKQKRRTTVIVAHRLSTIRNADMIAVVNDGKVCELGTHDELADYVQVETPKGNNEIDVTNASSDQTKNTKMVSMSKLFTFADTTDKILMAVGTVTAMLTGVSQPVQIIFFGDIINAFNPTQGGKINDDEFRHNINKVVIQFAVLGAVVMVIGFTQIACWSIAASRQAKRLRHAYAAAILRQEVGWFDVNEPMQLATKVADTTLIIQEGMGRKVADGINFSTMALSGFIIAFIYGWELALVLFAFTPLIAISGYFMIKAISSATQGGVDSYAEAGGIAEESLSNIKTVHMFNAMAKMAEKYKASLFKTELAGVKKGLAVGIGTGGMFFVVFCTYAVGMYYGAVKVTNDQIPADSCTGQGCYDGGRVIIIFFSIVMSSMALGQAGPSAQAMFAARSAAHD